MRVVVTGAAGLVGRVVAQHYNAIALSHADLDITDGTAGRGQSAIWVPT